MITKEQALNDFIERRVIGDDPFGISVEPDYFPDDDPTATPEPGPVRCIYMKSVGGGCAIGKWIPEALYSTRFESKGVEPLFEEHPEIAALFEEPNGDFWKALQSAHDSLAIYLARRHYTSATNKTLTSERWTRFEQALREAGGSRVTFILGEMPGTNKTKRRQLARARVLNKLAKEPTTAAFFTMPERSQLRDLQNEGLITIGQDYRWRRTPCLRCGNPSTMRMKDGTTMMCEEHGTFYAEDFK